MEDSDPFKIESKVGCQPRKEVSASDKMVSCACTTLVVSTGRDLSEGSAWTQVSAHSLLFCL